MRVRVSVILGRAGSKVNFSKTIFLNENHFFLMKNSRSGIGTIKERHAKNCLDHEACSIKMPTEGKNFIKFSDYSARYRLPVVLYFDFESLILPVTGCQNDPHASSTTTLHQHVPCSFSLAVVETIQTLPTV